MLCIWDVLFCMACEEILLSMSEGFQKTEAAGLSGTTIFTKDGFGDPYPEKRDQYKNLTMEHTSGVKRQYIVKIVNSKMVCIVMQIASAEEEPAIIPTNIFCEY